MAARFLDGALETLPEPIDPGIALEQLLRESPEVAFAEAAMARAQALVQRQRAERSPNLNVALGPSYDFETEDVIGEVDLEVPLLLFNRNQGALRAARAELLRAEAELRRVELSLRSRFAPAFEEYETSERRVEEYRERVFPAAARAYELALDAYRRGAESFDQVLATQRNLFEVQADLVDADQELHEAVVRIRGFFLEAGLEPVAPPEPAELPETPVNPFP
jgi:cobalt-zinc-cadmium efflux system outer membrane protein